MSSAIEPTVSYTFDESVLEWVLNLSLPNLKGVSRHLLLKRVWVTRQGLSDLEESFGTLNTQKIVAGVLNSSVGGGSFVRAILPSEIGDYSKAEDLAGDILSRYNNAGDVNRPLNGYFFYLDTSITEGFLNYDLMAKCITAIRAAHKSHTGEYLSSSENYYVPVNAVIYSTYPVRLVVGSTQVVGCKAGDIIRYSTTGGSGEYTVTLDDSLSLLQEYKGIIKVVKNTSGTARVIISDPNDSNAPTSELIVTVEEVS